MGKDKNQKDQPTLSHEEREDLVEIAKLHLIMQTLEAEIEENESAENQKD